MNLQWTPEAWEDYLYWQAHNQSLLKKINTLIKECLCRPTEGTGKPEPLKFQKSGYWSRRINHEHRLVYKVTNDSIVMIQARYHYQ